MRCSFCQAEDVDLWPTSGRNHGCPRCVASMPTCCRCGIHLERSGGKWFDDGLAYCVYCEQEAPKCLWCRRPAFERASQEICVYCADNFPRCDRCQELIHGSCVTYLDRVYCQGCGGRYPLCLECGTAVEGSACPACGGPARACGGCGKLFSERWLVHEDTWYCPSCYWRACGCCRFCQEKKPVVRDNCCSDCRSDLVLTPAAARTRLDQVQRFCRQELGLVVNEPYELRLVEPGQAMPRVHTDVYMLSLSTVGLWEGEQRVMWVNRGYPGWFTAVILAHEHAHAWQDENAPEQSQDVLEGFASWVEWHMAQALGRTAFAENMVALDCPIYGQGLRRCLQLEEQVGPEALVERMRGLQSFSFWTSVRAWFR